MLIKPIKTFKKIHQSKKAVVTRLNLGEQDAIDLISYAGLEEQADYLVMDDYYVRTLFIAGYPFTATSGWLNSLINFNSDIDISYHLINISPTEALPKLNRKITELESTKRAMLRQGQLIGPDITDPLESAKSLRNSIHRGQEKLFQMSVYMCLKALTLEELNKQTRLLETTLAARLIIIKSARYQQIEGLQSILPRSQDELSQKRNLDSTSTSLTFPFISSELVQDSGILYGINKSNNSLVILDRYSLNNANSIIFAQSGSGKSYASKVEILRQLMQGTKVIVIDPEREYKLLTKSVGGSYIKLSSRSKQKINPFDLATTSRTRQELAEHIQDLTELISLMSDGLSNSEKAAVDRAILKIYKNSKAPPLLENLYETLHNQGQIKLKDRLEKYISGSLADVFNSHTNIDLSNRLVVFDIKDLPDSIRQIMILIVANFVKNQVKANPEKRLLVIDEGWMLLEQEASARFITGLVRRARKYYLGVSIISQAANDFLSSDYGRAIAAQSSLRILMRQDTTTIKNITSQFKLSEYEQNFLLTCDKGEALLLADQIHVAVKIIASKREHPLITTNPQELYG